MATFSAVNTSLSPSDAVRPGEEQTPTTPRPGAMFAQQASGDGKDEESPAVTPTRQSFGGLSDKVAFLDESPTPAQTQDTHSEPQESLKRNSAHFATIAEQAQETQDVEMGDGDGEGDNVEDDDGSDNDSVTSDSQRPSKKKKGQRFFCTEFPPCQLSFTRSEHLARHIRYV